MTELKTMHILYFCLVLNIVCAVLAPNVVTLLALALTLGSAVLTWLIGGDK